MKENKSKQILEKLYAAEDNLQTEDGKDLKANPEGSLGLLALGYRGLIAWRKAKKQSK
jgi:hypothetical protein